tara:strand:+ start:697 stop:1410 length:714 start_codon:yes stop_codon:yes gene_type:complete
MSIEENIQDYRYTDHIRENNMVDFDPDKMKVTETITDNVDKMINYSMGYFIAGIDLDRKNLELGTNYFLDTNMKCSPETSSDECKNKPRYTYIRNIPTGTLPIAEVGLFEATRCNLTGIVEARGIIPGMIEDVYDLSPGELLNMSSGVESSNSNHGNSCRKVTLPVGYNIYNPNGQGKTWDYQTVCSAGYKTLTKTSDKKFNTALKEENEGELKFRDFKGVPRYNGNTIPYDRYKEK